MTGSRRSRVVNAYAVGPRTARERAREIRAAPMPERRRDRPVAQILVGGAVALAAMAALLVTAVAYWGDVTISGSDAAIRLAVFGPLYAAGVYVACLGWERGERDKALRLAIILGIFGLAILAVVALILILIAKSDGEFDLDLGDVGKALDGDRSGGADAVADVVQPVVQGVFREVGPDDPLASWSANQQAGIASAAAVQPAAVAPPSDLPPPLAREDPRGHDCARCGYRFDGAAHLACPSCGQPT